MDLRRRVIAACEAGEESQAEVAARFSVGRTTVVMWLRLQRETGDVVPREGKTGPPSTVTPKHLAALRKIIERRPDLTYLELTERWNKAIGLDRHRSVTVRAVKALGYTLKKVLRRQRAGRGGSRASASRAPKVPVHRRARAPDLPGRGRRHACDDTLARACTARCSGDGPDSAESGTRDHDARRNLAPRRARDGDHRRRH
jgi:transposase